MDYLNPYLTVEDLASLAPDGERIPAILLSSNEPRAEFHRLKLEMDGYLVRMTCRAAPGMSLAVADAAIVFLDVRSGKSEDLETYEGLCLDPAVARLPIVLLSQQSQKQIADKGFALREGDHLIYEPPLAELQSVS